METLTVTERSICESMGCSDIAVLKIGITYPEFSGAAPKKALSRINGFYAKCAKRLRDMCAKRLYPGAVRDFNAKLDAGITFNPFECVVRFYVPYNEFPLLSVYFDIYEYAGGVHGSTHRDAVTWDAARGWPLPLCRFFARDENYKRLLIRNSADIIASELESGFGDYFPNYRRLLRKYFCADNFYLTPEGLVSFYRQITIAPYYMGIPGFTLSRSFQPGEPPMPYSYVPQAQ